MLKRIQPATHQWICRLDTDGKLFVSSTPASHPARLTHSWVRRLDTLKLPANTITHSTARTGLTLKKLLGLLSSVSKKK